MIFHFFLSSSFSLNFHILFLYFVFFSSKNFHALSSIGFFIFWFETNSFLSLRLRLLTTVVCVRMIWAENEMRERACDMRRQRRGREWDNKWLHRKMIEKSFSSLDWKLQIKFEIWDFMPANFWTLLLTIS